jgi:hypothetical protein
MYIQSNIVVCLHNNCCHENTMYRRTCHCQECTKHRMQCHGNTTVCCIYCCTTHYCQQTATRIFMNITRHLRQSLTKFGFPDQIFTEVPNTKFHKKIYPVGAVLIITCGQTHEETLELIGNFHNYANTP